MGLACSEWVNICRPQTAIQICREGIGWLGPGRLPSWRVTGYEVTGNKLKHREVAGFGDIPRAGGPGVSLGHVRVLTRWSAFVSVMTRVRHHICAASLV